MKRQNLDQLIEQGYDFDIEEAFRNGWEMFKSKALVSMAYGILILSLQFMFAIHLDDLAVLFSVFLAAPLYSGFFLVANKISRNEEVRYSDFFGGFVYYIPIILVWVVGQIIAAVGLCQLLLSYTVFGRHLLLVGSGTIAVAQALARLRHNAVDMVLRFVARASTLAGD